MNTREAMQALIAGKKVTTEEWDAEEYVMLDDRGILVDELRQRVSLSARHDFKLYEEPNPHTVGTFAWAREEAKRGRYVRRRSIKARATNALYKGRRNFAPETDVSIEDVDATDWESVE